MTYTRWTERSRGAKCVLMGLAWALGAAAAPVWAGDVAPTVKACGIRIAAEGYGGDQGLRPFNWFKGTTVALLVEAPQGGLISYDDNASELTKLVDDKGTNLLVKAGFSTPGLSGFGEVSEDGKAMIVEAVGGEVPQAGAKTIQAQGKIVAQMATKKQTHTVNDVKLAKGGKIQAGPVDLTIEEVGKPGWGDMPMQVSLKADRDLTDIAAVRFLDEQGKAIESESAGSSRMSFGDQVTVTREYRLAREVEAVTVEIDVWTDLRTVEVPFDVTTGVGLGK